MSKSTANWYNSLFQEKPKDSKLLKTELLHNLYTRPRKPKLQAAVSKSNIAADAVHQCDILMLPNDNGYRYALVVCDVGGKRETDAEPLRTKDAESVLKAFKIIYKRKLLKFPPMMLQCDSGGEFKSVVKKYFEDAGVAIRVGKVDHHQSQASVEAKNLIIGKALHMRMAAQELETGETSREWTEFLPILITHLNTRMKKSTKPFTKFDAPVASNKTNRVLLDEGTDVRVALDAPKDVATGSKLHGKFRASDTRWEFEPTQIKQILLRPDQPPMYLTNRYPHTPVLREFVQVVPDVENKPPATMSKKFVVEQLVSRKKIKNKIYFVVKWKNYNSEHNTEELRTKLMIDVPDMVKEFESR
jgi:hypothetical protein